MTTVYTSFYIFLDRKQSQRNHKHQKTSNLVGTEEKSFQFLVHTFMKRENLYCIQQNKKYMFLTFKFFLPMFTLSLLSRQFSLSCFQTFFYFSPIYSLYFSSYLLYCICLKLSLSFFLLVSFLLFNIYYLCFFLGSRIGKLFKLSRFNSLFNLVLTSFSCQV